MKSSAERRRLHAIDELESKRLSIGWGRPPRLGPTFCPECEGDIDPLTPEERAFSDREIREKIRHDEWLDRLDREAREDDEDYMGIWE